MKLLISVVSFAALAGMSLAGAGSAAAHGGDNSTCAGVVDTGDHVHGDHVIRDYVGDVGQGEGGADLPGGPGPGFHFTIDGLAPGASFCNPQAHPNGFDTPDSVPVPGDGS
jgi:hypothetical protein